jgi:hypothetical protein
LSIKAEAKTFSHIVGQFAYYTEYIIKRSSISNALNNDYLFHREDGPARVWFGEDFSKLMEQWYYLGKYIECSNQKEFERLIKLQLLW